MNKYILIKIMNKLMRKDGKSACENINSYFRKQGMIIGEGCRFYSNILTSEPYLVEIGSNVTISNDVQILTHDNSIIKFCSNFTDIFGPVKIGDNCFIGSHSLILPGVTIGKNCIIGAGSVVTKSVSDGSVIAGNPARYITSFEEFNNRNARFGLNISGLSLDDKRQLIMDNHEKWISR